MTDCAVLIEEIQTLSPSSRDEVLDFVEFIKYKSRKETQPVEKADKSAAEIAREMWNSLPTIEECIAEADAKYAAWKDTGIDPLEKFRGSKIFGDGTDGLTYQRKMRAEWDREWDNE